MTWFARDHTLSILSQLINLTVYYRSYCHVFHSPNQYAGSLQSLRGCGGSEFWCARSIKIITKQPRKSNLNTDFCAISGFGATMRCHQLKCCGFRVCKSFWYFQILIVVLDKIDKWDSNFRPCLYAISRYGMPKFSSSTPKRVFGTR